ncbi:MAG TPA: hypothetical protein VF638_02995, partial [Sphingomonas sp.]
PTTAEVLDLLDRTPSERVYRDIDQGDADIRRSARENAEWLDRVDDELDMAASDHGTTVAPHERDVMRALMGDGRTADDAFITYHERELAEAMNDVRAETNNPVYEGPYDAADPGPDRAPEGPDSASEAGDRGPAGIGRDEGAAPQDRADTRGGDDGQGDAFGARPEDQRRTLERAAEGRARAGVGQKAPGSDGGLFDTRDTTGDMFDAPARAAEPAAEAPNTDLADLKAFRDSGGKIDPETQARLTKAGLMEHAAGFERPRITDEGLAALRDDARQRRKTQASNEEGFITADMLMAPFRAIAKVADIADWKAIRGDLGKFRAMFGEPGAAMKSVLEPMQRVVSAALYSNDSRLRGLAARFESPAIRELADHFQAEPGKGSSTGRTYHEAVQRASITRTQSAFDALEPHIENPAAMARIRDLLATPNKSVKATVEERAAATTIRDLLKETLEYRRAAGEEIGEVSDGYFPRMLNAEKVAHQREDFLARAEKLYRGTGLSERDAKASASAWFNHVFDTYAGLDGGLGFTRAGGDSIGNMTTKTREFGKQADELLRDYYEGDVMSVMAGYFGGAARKAEYTRRFGKKGAVGSPERLAWEKEHNGKTQLEVLEDRLKADVRSSDAEPAGVLNQIESVMKSNLGQMGTKDQFARTAVSYLHTWNQLAKMDRVTISSLGDLTMGFIRGGPRYGFSFFKDAVQETVRQIRKAPPSDAARWAEAFGVANDAFVNQVLTSRAGIEGGTAGTQKVLTNFYKAVGLHQFTEGGRIAAAKMAQKMVHTFAGDLQSSSPRIRNRAALYLKELGIKDVDAFGKQLREGTPSRDDVLGDKGFAADYGTAVYRAVQQTILMPNRAEKPTWSAHPVGSLAFSLMSYSYGFKKNVLDRSARLGVRAFKDKDAALLIPAFSLSIMAAFQGVNDTYLRPALFGSSYDFDKESPTEAMMRIADRAGFLGATSPIFNAIKAVKYDRSLAESLSGPVIGSVLNAAQKGIVEPLSERNSENTTTSERNAAAAFYDAVIDPAVDGIAAARLKGIARSVAIIGSGNKDGGVLPGDKSAFIDTVGGEAPEKDDE